MKNLKGSISGGVDISHKGPKMSGKAKDLMSFPGGMPGPGAYGSVGNKVVGKGMMKYMAGEGCTHKRQTLDAYSWLNDARYKFVKGPSQYAN